VSELLDCGTTLHALRSAELAKLPPGARTVLGGGAANAHYFNWFNEFYPSAVERHIGVEAYAPRPEDLPPEAEWLPRTLGDLGPVADGEVDLVFAGQVIEHLWPDEVVGFLAEAARVLRPGGLIAVDSVNRVITQAQGWVHPDHTVEFTPDEIQELLGLAGFDDVEVRGVWLCYQREQHRVLPWNLMDIEGASHEWRSSEAADRPEDSIIWWAEARRGDRPPDIDRLRARAEAIADRFRATAMTAVWPEMGTVGHRAPGELVVETPAGAAGVLVDGPRRPVPPGRWIARWRVGLPLPPELRRRVAPGQTLGRVEVCSGDDPVDVLAERALTPAEIGIDGVLREVAVPFVLGETTMCMRFRVQTSGALPLRARVGLDLEPADEYAERRRRPRVWRGDVPFIELRSRYGPRALAARLRGRRAG